MKKKPAQWMFILFVLTALVLSACQETEQTHENQEDTTEAEQTVNPEDSPPLRLSITRPSQMNPLLNENETLFQIHHFIYDSLVTFDEKMNIQPELAEDWDVDSQGRTVTFSLREGVTWHDGEPLTPEDVLFTVQILRDRSGELGYPGLYAENIQQISDVRIIEEEKIQFTFTRPFGNALETLMFPILPRHLFEDDPDRLTSTNEFPMTGTGRYEVVQHDMSRAMELKAYSDYWGEKPYIDEIHVAIVPDRQAQISLFENGKLDLVEPDSIDWARYTDQADVEAYTFNTRYYEFLGFNFQQDYLHQSDFRKAVVQSIDRQKILEDIYFGHGHITDVPVPPDSWLYDENDPVYSRDPGEAQDLLESLEIPEDKVFQLMTNDGNPLREMTAIMIADSLDEVGLQVEVELYEWEEIQEKLDSGDYDFVLAGWHLSLIPDLSFAFHSTQLDNQNFIRYESEKMDEQLEIIFETMDRETKKKEWETLQAMIREELPYASLFFKENALLHRTTLEGELNPNAYHIYRGIESVYLTEQEEGSLETGD